MKRLLLLVLLTVAVSDGLAQTTTIFTQESDTLYVSTAWRTFQKSDYKNIFWFEVSQDSTGGEIFVALQSDTTTTKRFKLKASEVKVWSGVNITHFMVRSKAGTIPIRVEYR